ncbi:hypothetical protein ASPZODRAFT_1236583 [Penicilliopsis zonata CBS 506.65]|uniref:Uncharacterized protein n=1 Tax=Penicilliopsis zonata CBS 506.65 TaxID=1073090 RepID=A0A1L9S6Y4_9EURO|nr:hypothetical protein ASPZODRAFT_1236583 [Penicilliopsis zonata CBS 506.65]OJJ42898.1 hypothetical protein ASPZODRAFT_1236583 [Penicilliopsis zonata CBS 506.65]
MSYKGQPGISVMINPPTVNITLYSPLDEDSPSLQDKSTFPEDENSEEGHSARMDTEEEEDTAAWNALPGCLLSDNEVIEEEDRILACVSPELREPLLRFISSHPFISDCEAGLPVTLAARDGFKADVRRKAIAAGMKRKSNITDLLVYVTKIYVDVVPVLVEMQTGKKRKRVKEKRAKKSQRLKENPPESPLQSDNSPLPTPDESVGDDLDGGFEASGSDPGQEGDTHDSIFSTRLPEDQQTDVSVDVANQPPAIPRSSGYVPDDQLTERQLIRKESNRRKRRSRKLRRALRNRMNQIKADDEGTGIPESEQEDF